MTPASPVCGGARRSTRTAGGTRSGSTTRTSSSRPGPHGRRSDRVRPGDGGRLHPARQPARARQAVPEMHRDLPRQDLAAPPREPPALQVLPPTLTVTAVRRSWRLRRSVASRAADSASTPRQHRGRRTRRRGRGRHRRRPATRGVGDDARQLWRRVPARLRPVRATDRCAGRGRRRRPRVGRHPSRRRVVTDADRRLHRLHV